MNRSKIVKLIAILMISLIFIGIPCHYYFYKTTNGILLRNGIRASDIKSTLETPLFNFYLYQTNEGNKNKLGIFTIQKYNDIFSTKSQYYNDKTDIKGEFTPISAFYHTIDGGWIVSHNVWGGCIKTNNNKEFQVAVNKYPYTPQSVFSSDGYTYFLVDVGRNNGEEIEIVY